MAAAAAVEGWAEAMLMLGAAERSGEVTLKSTGAKDRKKVALKLRRAEE